MQGKRNVSVGIVGVLALAFLTGCGTSRLTLLKRESELKGFYRTVRIKNVESTILFPEPENAESFQVALSSAFKFIGVKVLPEKSAEKADYTVEVQNVRYKPGNRTGRLLLGGGLLFWPFHTFFGIGNIVFAGSLKSDFVVWHGDGSEKAAVYQATDKIYGGVFGGDSRSMFTTISKRLVNQFYKETGWKPQKPPREKSKPVRRSRSGWER